MFNPTEVCQPGGLYFAQSINLLMWSVDCAYVGDVEVPDDAQVYCEIDTVESRFTKFKADKFILHNSTRTFKQFYEQNIHLAKELEYHWPILFYGTLN